VQLRPVPAISAATSGSSAGHTIGTEVVAPVGVVVLVVTGVVVAFVVGAAAGPRLPGAVTLAMLLVVTPVVVT
jgi:hypothetical protein